MVKLPFQFNGYCKKKIGEYAQVGQYFVQLEYTVTGEILTNLVGYVWFDDNAKVGSYGIQTMETMPDSAKRFLVGSPTEAIKSYNALDMMELLRTQLGL